MVLDTKLLQIIVCPQCKGEVTVADSGWALSCDRCKLKYPIRDGIPVMVVEEAYDMRLGPRVNEGGNVRFSRVSFRVVDGPDKNMTFQIDYGSCRAVGRTTADVNKTSVLSVDVALALDDSTRALIMKYISAQFKKGNVDTRLHADSYGHFRRAPDIVLTDQTLSRLHVMIFADESQVGVLDLVSKNGTFINGQEVESRTLNKGDKIELGDTTILFEG